MPPHELGHCVIARLHPLREADLIVSLLSPTRGRVDAVARGARSSRRRFAGTLQLFSEISASLQVGRGSMPVLAEAGLVRNRVGTDIGYAQLCLASYATELALVASQPDHADADLYAWLCAWLDISARDMPALRSLRVAAEVTFLQVLGLFPDVRACVRCGGETSAGAAWPDPAEGLWCLACAGPARPVVAPDMLLALAALTAQTEPSAELAAALPDATLRPVEDRVARLVARALPQTLRSAAALQAALRDGG